MATMQYVGDLVVETCWCGIRHAVPKELVDHQLRQFRDGEKQVGICCPLGHNWIRSGEGRAKELERQVQQERQRRDQAEADAKRQRELREKAERSLTAQRGVTTRIKNRVHKGVCPCCNRHFTNLERHMQNQHPDYLTADAESK